MEGMEGVSFSNAIPLIFKHEGGYVNDPQDPGGETKYGISKRSYPDENIKNLTEERAKLIYLRDFWNPLKCDSLPFGVAVCVFDFGVNAGKGRAVRALQESVGAKADGVIGPDTISRVQNIPSSETIEKFTSERIYYYTQLKTWPRFGRGWLRRSLETMSYALTIGPLRD